MSYDSEARFEADLIRTLVEEKGWKDGVLRYKDEKDLIQNWANIIYENNRSVDRLGDYPITQGEMQQILEQMKALKTPLKLNGQMVPQAQPLPFTLQQPQRMMHSPRSPVAAGCGFGLF